MALAFSSIHFTILYEKALKNFPQKLTKALIDKALEDYNRYLEGTGIAFSLDSVMDYEQYSQMREFRVFSRLAGEDSLKRRLRALKGIDTNLIIIYSSISKDNASGFNLLNACRSRYFVNLMRRTSSSSEVLPASLESIKDWMSDLLKVDMPDFYELSDALHSGDSSQSTPSFDAALVKELVQCLQFPESAHASVGSGRVMGWSQYNMSAEFERKIRHLEDQIEALQSRQDIHLRKLSKTRSFDFNDARLSKHMTTDGLQIDH